MNTADPMFTVIVPIRDRPEPLARAFRLITIGTQGSAAVRLPLSEERESARDEAAHE